MESTLIILSIPVFLAFIGGELWLSRRRGRQLYRWADSVANLFRQHGLTSETGTLPSSTSCGDTVNCKGS